MTKRFLVRVVIAALLAAIILTLIGTTSLAAVEFSDEFNAATLDLGKWWYGFPYPNKFADEGNNELAVYHQSQVIESGGLLDLRAEKLATPETYCYNTCRQYPYLSGMAQSGGVEGQTPVLYSMGYGTIEARIKIPKGKGLWPAFWLLEDTRLGKPSHEIDVIEFLGDTPNLVRFHFHDPDAGTHVGYNWDAGVDMSLDFHTYGVTWSANQIQWFVDGVERWRWSGPTYEGKMFILLNLAVGGDWPGAPDASTVFPADMLVDWVRVTTTTPATPTLAPTSTSTKAPTLAPTIAPSRTPTTILLPTVTRTPTRAATTAPTSTPLPPIVVPTTTPSRTSTRTRTATPGPTDVPLGRCKIVSQTRLADGALRVVMECR